MILRVLMDKITYLLNCEPALTVGGKLSLSNVSPRASKSSKAFIALGFSSGFPFITETEK